MELMRELSYKKSWGRNQVINLGIDKDLQIRLSSTFETPNVSRGEAMLNLVKLHDKSQTSLNIQHLCSLFYELCDNQTKDSVISYCLEEGLSAKFINKFSDKLRATNSKRHLRDKLLLTYLEING